MKNFLLFLLLLPIICFSQVKGKFRVFSDPANAIIKYESQQLDYGKTYELDTGKLTIRAWAPKCELIEREIHLNDSIMMTVRMDLPYSEEYKKYRYNTGVYYAGKYTLKYATPILYLVFALNSSMNIRTLNDDAERFKEEATFYRNEYERSFWVNDLNFNKIRFNQSKENHKDAVDNVNNEYLKLQIGTGVAIAATYFGWKLAKRLKKPTYTEKPLLTNITIAPSFYNKLGLTLNSKF